MGPGFEPRRAHQKTPREQAVTERTPGLQADRNPRRPSSTMATSAGVRWLLCVHRRSSLSSTITTLRVRGRRTPNLLPRPVPSLDASTRRFSAVPIFRVVLASELGGVSILPLRERHARPEADGGLDRKVVH